MTENIPDNAQNERRSRLAGVNRSYAGRSARRDFFIRFFKYGLPLLGFFFLVSLFAFPYLLKQTTNLTFDEIKINEQVGHIEMVNPVYKSFGKDQTPYRVSAQTAVRMIDNPDSIWLSEPRALIGKEIEAGNVIEDTNQNMLTVSATSGDYDQEIGQLNLKGKVQLRDQQGYVLNGESLMVDLKTGDATSAQPINGIGPRGVLKAEGLIVKHSGSHVILQGRSQIILR